MRKWIAGSLLVSLGAVGMYGYFARKSEPIRPHESSRTQQSQTSKTSKDDGDAEASDVIEPLVVDRGEVGVASDARPRGAEADPAPRVQWTPGMALPLRPDAGQGVALRMPYADEKVVLAPPFDPIQWILESPLPTLPRMDEDPAEESEPPMPEPHSHPHCPHMGGCPAPFPYRMFPR